MAVQGDEDLAALIVREQRGFRRILYAGLFTLLLMAVISIAMGINFWLVSTDLGETNRRLQRDAFDSRIAFVDQSARLAAQERGMRRIYAEVRRAADGGADVEATPARIAETQTAVQMFFLRGRLPSLTEQRAIRQFGVRELAGVSPAYRALMIGAWEIVTFENNGDQIPNDAEALPANLQRAMDSFQAARSDPTLEPIARAGAAWILFTDANQRQAYAEPACEAVFQAVEGLHNGVEAPRPLYWRAQCERKRGRTTDALANYARSLAVSAPNANAAAENDGGSRRVAEAETQLAMDAFHGVGTTLIASADVADDAPEIREALAIARQWCATGEDAGARTERMQLAVACLQHAIKLRRDLDQIPSQISGTAENLSFAYLRDGNFDAAYQNATAVEGTGLFAWNEAVRALAAERARAGAERDRRAAGSEARRNVAMFRLEQFNLCELRVLMTQQLYDDLVEIIEAEHKGETVGCAAGR